MGTTMVPGRKYFERAGGLEIDTTDMVPKPPSPTGFRITTDTPFLVGVVLFLLIGFGILYIIYRCSQFSCKFW